MLHTIVLLGVLPGKGIVTENQVTLAADMKSGLEIVAADFPHNMHGAPSALASDIEIHAPAIYWALVPSCRSFELLLPQSTVQGSAHPVQAKF